MCSWSAMLTGQEASWLGAAATPNCIHGPVARRLPLPLAASSWAAAAPAPSAVPACDKEVPPTDKTAPCIDGGSRSLQRRGGGREPGRVAATGGVIVAGVGAAAAAPKLHNPVRQLLPSTSELM
jgi:hypothetical protein